MARDFTDRRAATPVAGNVLLVAVVVVLGATLMMLSLTFLERTGTPTADATFEYEQTSAGLRMMPTAIGTDVAVELNGKQVTTFDADAAGQSTLLPTAPGDRITVVSNDRDRSVLVNKQIDSRSEIGDFIAYYTFEDSESKDTLEDQSGNGNDGTVVGDHDWGSSSLTFDGSDDYVKVRDISSEVAVSEFTVAVVYETNDATEKQELVEHKSGDDNWLLELKPCTHPQVNTCSAGDKYVPVYTVDKAGGTQDGQIFGGSTTAGTKQVLVGTYDGSEYTLYVDGKQATSDTYTGEISMGDMNIARDIEFNGDHLDGKIYEIRLYYTAFDGDRVEVITEAMS